MKLNKYHKEVLSVALEIFEQCGDDSFLDISDDAKLYKAFRQLRKFSTPPSIKIPKKLKTSKDSIIMGNLTPKDVFGFEASNKIQEK